VSQQNKKPPLSQGSPPPYRSFEDTRGTRKWAKCYFFSFLFFFFFFFFIINLKDRRWILIKRPTKPYITPQPQKKTPRERSFPSNSSSPFFFFWVSFFFSKFFFQIPKFFFSFIFSSSLSISARRRSYPF
jgi:hypothetical protein